MPPTLLLTRPDAAARRFVAELDLPGLSVMISPLIRITPVAHDATTLAMAPGLVFTSVHAVPWGGPGKGRPAFCVGPATATAARAAGFSVTQGPGDAEGLIPLLGKLPDGALHPRGAHIARPLPVPGVVVYDQVAQPLSVQARALLAGPGPVILPLFSPRSARLMAAEAGGARAALWLAPISPAAADAWGDAGFARRMVATSPDATGVRAAIQDLLATEQSR